MGSQSPYQHTITQTLEVLGWEHMHVRPVFDARAKRWVTPTTARGWPDLTACHNRTGVLLFAELKGALTLKRKTWSTADVRSDQLDWLVRLHRNPGAAAVVLRPTDDWNMVVGWLQDPSTLRSGYGWLPPEQHHGVLTWTDARDMLYSLP